MKMKFVCVCVYLEKYTPNLPIADSESIGQHSQFKSSTLETESYEFPEMLRMRDVRRGSQKVMRHPILKTRFKHIHDKDLKLRILLTKNIAVFLYSNVVQQKI